MSNGSGNYTYEIIDKSAPTGISFNSSTMMFVGTPTANVGTYTIKLKATDSTYNQTVTTNFTLEIEAATMSYTVTPYSGAYSGSAHHATVKMTTPATATVGYSDTSGTYTTYTLDATGVAQDFANMGRTDVGATTIYYQITEANYTTVTINQSTGHIEFKSKEGSGFFIVGHQTTVVTVTRNGVNMVFNLGHQRAYV